MAYMSGGNEASTPSQLIDDFALLYHCPTQRNLCSGPVSP